MRKSHLMLSIDRRVCDILRLKELNVSQLVNTYLTNLLKIQQQTSTDQQELVQDIEQLEQDIKKLEQEYQQKLATLVSSLSLKKDNLNKLKIQKDKDDDEELRKALEIDRTLKANNVVLNIMEGRWNNNETTPKGE